MTSSWVWSWHVCGTMANFLLTCVSSAVLEYILQIYSYSFTYQNAYLFHNNIDLYCIFNPGTLKDKWGNWGLRKINLYFSSISVIFMHLQSLFQLIWTAVYFGGNKNGLAFDFGGLQQTCLPCGSLAIQIHFFLICLPMDSAFTATGFWILWHRSPVILFPIGRQIKTCSTSIFQMPELVWICCRSLL